MKVTEGLAPLNLDLLEVSGEHTDMTSTPRAAAGPSRRRRRSSCQHRMSVSDRDDAEDDENGSPVSRREWSPQYTSSSASSAGSPGLCDMTPGSAGSDATKGGNNNCKRRPSISDLTDSARMTPEDRAERGAGFPWQRCVGLFKLELGSSPSGAGEAERERARNFCILDTPELCRGSSPLLDGDAVLACRVPGESDCKERSPQALQRSFEDNLLQAHPHSPKVKPSSKWLSPQRLADLQCPASLAGLCARDDLPTLPFGSPPARPVQRRPLKRARPEAAIRGGGC